MRKLSKVGWLVLLVLLMCVAVTAQGKLGKMPNLTGFVYIEGSKGEGTATAQYGFEGLAGVEVKLQGTELKAVTNDRGYYQFEDAPEGAQVLVFEKEGYQTVTKSVSVSKGTGLPSNVNVALHPEGLQVIGGALVGPGTVYIAYAERNPNQANSAGNPTKAFQNKTLMGAVAAGVDPLSVGSNLPPPELRADQHEQNPTTTDPNHLMILPPNNPTKSSFTTLSTRPMWLCFNKTGSTLFVSSMQQMIMVYDSAHGNRLLRNLPTNGAVTELTLSLDGRYVLAGIMAASSGVMLIDTLTNEPGAFIPCPSPPRSVAMSGNLVFACTGDTSKGQVMVLDAGSARPLKSIPVGNQPTGIALAPNGRFLYCVNSGSASVSVIDIASLSEIARVPVGINPQKVAVSPDSSRVFVTNKQNNSVSVLDGKSQVVIATTTVSAGPIGVAVSKDGSKCYVACKDAGNIVVLDGKTGASVHTTVPMPNSSPWGVAIRP